MSKKQKIGQCVYCGSNGPITKDHIPPGNLFSAPRPNNLIAVPSCFSCNNEASKDDEYFRLVIVSREDTAEHSGAKGVLPATLRAFSKPNKKGFKKAFFNSIHEFECVTPAGLYLGKGAAYDVKTDRLNCVATRVIKGLFYHHKGIRIPEKYQATAYVVSSLDQNDNEIKTFLSSWASLTNNKAQKIGDSVFSYWFHFLEDDENCSMWLLRFFETVDFVGGTFLKRVMLKGKEN